MKHSWMLALTVAWAAALPAEMPAGRTILTAVDRNMGSDTKVSTARMVIEGRRGTRTVAFKSWIRGMDESFTEYLEPPREKGVKMLKLGDQLWAYYPTTDRTIKISGHMLRQSVMGSDLSYEDLMEDTKLLNHYNAVVTGSEKVGNDDCWVLELTAFDPEVTYQGRKLWVDKLRNIPLKEELFAKSGTLLKRTELSDITKIDGRWYPRKIVFKDMLQEGEGTEFIIEEIKFNIDIPDYIFSKGSLKK